MFPLCGCVYCRLKKKKLSADCIDKTHEYLSRAIYHLTPLALPPLTPKQYSLRFSFCAQRRVHIHPTCQQSVFISSVWPVSSHPTLHLSSPHFYVSSLSSLVFFFHPIEKWRTRCRCSDSSSARPSASLTSAWPLWSSPLMFWGIHHVTSYYPFKSAPFYPNSAAMKADLKHMDLPSSPFLTRFYTSCLHRALLTGLTSNPHINDLHLDISGCEVSVHLCSEVKGVVQCFFLMQLNSILQLIAWTWIRASNQFQARGTREKKLSKCLNEVVCEHLTQSRAEDCLKLKVPTLWVTPKSHRNRHI